jgi:molybdenum cofactor cytidylyltransferase
MIRHFELQFKKRLCSSCSRMIMQTIAGVILAAGQSRRFGRPKQLLKLKNKYLFEWVLDAALSSNLASVVLVLGYQNERVRRALGTKVRHPRLRVVANERYQEGLSRSLQIGLAEVQDASASVMFLLGDQPMVRPETINHLLECFSQSDKDMCVPIYRGKRGTPTIIGRKFYHQILNLQGDVGARNFIEAHHDLILEVEVNDPLCFFDIDTPGDLATLQSLLS